jgi:hypothetical protein
MFGLGWLFTELIAASLQEVRTAHHRPDGTYEPELPASNAAPYPSASGWASANWTRTRPRPADEGAKRPARDAASAE